MFYILVLSQLIFFLSFPLWIDLTGYLHNSAAFVLWAIYTLSAIYIIWLARGASITIPQWFLHLAAILYTAVLAILLFLRPAGQIYNSINLVPFKTILFYLSGEVNFLIAFYNIAANIGLFVPFGLYYCYLVKSRSFGRVSLYAVLSIVAVEVTQHLTGRGSLDIDDLILNVSGVMIGYFLFPAVHMVFKLRKSA